MNIRVELCDKENKFIINNIYPLYLYDLSEIWDRKPNKYGVFEEDDKYQTLEKQIPVFDIWWEKESVLFPYLFKADDIPVGFAFVAMPPHTPQHVDYLLYEFFLLRPYRGKGIGDFAAEEVFNKFLGSWELHTNQNTERNIRTLKFWRKTLSQYTRNNYIEENKDTSDGLMTVFSFNNH
jgi:predicted acetyltransferase